MGVFSTHNGDGKQPEEGRLNVLVFGAHPDDCDLRFGGAAMKYRTLGHRVKFVSMTNGDTGHFSMGGGPLARRRNEEAQCSGKIADVEYDVWDIHNGELEPTVAMRKRVIEEMRRFRADLVVCHRPNDYHPDHRAVGILVQDAAYIVTVPNVAPLTEPLTRSPVVMYAYDTFKLPTPFVPVVAIDTDDVFDRKIDMAHCHVSQMYEWLPYSGGELDSVPESDEDRRAWLAERLHRRFGAQADDVRDVLLRLYREQQGAAIKTAESFGLSEYGRRPPEEELLGLFPFLPPRE
jgi:LmbE family N-acetylglucosaminyl deacetylase